MLVPISWLKDFVDLDGISVETLAYRLTLAGLEVEAIRYVGLPMPEGPRHEFKISGLTWDPEKIVVGAVLEVMPHPNADRLVLCRLDDGQQEHTVVTGAPNLFPYKGKGPLSKPLKVPYAREGAVLLDPYAERPGATMVLKRRKIRGVLSYSMICSERELGISDEHEGIIILDDDAPVGMPLMQYMGDAVLDIAITPNMARNASILGVAREVAALFNRPLREPPYEVQATGPSIEGQAAVEITNPELNPRFVLGLIREVRIGASPYWVQRRLRLAGMRPINNIVDATNYVMLELGEPLHAFDYEVLVRRAGGKPPTIITRTARPGEKLTTLDGVERSLDAFTVLVCDTAGPLSIAGVMGGAESEVSESTRHVLLEGAAWNFINIRRTERAQGLKTEASYRFSRGVHPEPAVKRCLELMRQWAGGEVARGLVDNYPLPPQDPVITITPQEVARALGVRLSATEIVDLLERLGFTCKVEEGERLVVQTPSHRLDIGEGVIGKADLMEEIARIYGYDRIPETRLADALPPQKGNPDLEREDALRDALVDLGLQEVITYRLTAPEREARFVPHGDELPPYIELVNPIAHDRRVMRRALLPGLLEVAEANARFRDRQALFELGPVFLPQEGDLLPQEPRRLALVLTGPRAWPHWTDGNPAPFDFYDLKGVLEALAEALHLPAFTFTAAEHPALHPGKSATVSLNGQPVGFCGELHPETQARYEFKTPVLVAELDAEALLRAIPEAYAIQPVPAFPPVIEDLAVIVDETIPAAEVEAVIRKAGGGRLRRAHLFDVYRGEQIGAGKKSLAYRLTYQDPNKTLTDKDAAKIRQRIIRTLERELGAAIRGG